MTPSGDDLPTAGVAGPSPMSMPPSQTPQSSIRVFADAGSRTDVTPPTPTLNRQVLRRFFCSETHKSPTWDSYQKGFEECVPGHAHVVQRTSSKAEAMARQADIRASFAASAKSKKMDGPDEASSSLPTPAPEKPSALSPGPEPPSPAVSALDALERELEKMMDAELDMDGMMTAPSPSSLRGHDRRRDGDVAADELVTISNN